MPSKKLSPGFSSKLTMYKKIGAKSITVLEIVEFPSLNTPGPRTTSETLVFSEYQ